MFWDQVAGVYDVFVNVINRKTHKKLKMIVPRCRHLTATDYSVKMLQKAEKNCAAFRNIRFAQADITALAFTDGSLPWTVINSFSWMPGMPTWRSNWLTAGSPVPWQS